MSAPREHTIVCGSARSPKGAARVTRLSTYGDDANVNLRITDIADKLLVNIPDRTLDFIEIATYVYCADQAVRRGGDGGRQHGRRWRRSLRFRISVRDMDFWKTHAAELCRTLGFVSEDEYEFHFTKLRKPPRRDIYLDFGPQEGYSRAPEEVMLFSGGLDSLAGAVRETVGEGREVVLVGHSSVSKIRSRQKNLVDLLRKRHKARLLHIPVWVNKDSDLTAETSQRTRSFLYATMGFVVAQAVNLNRLRFYENGIVSINLPVSPQVLGARATRTTHPKFLAQLAGLLSSVADRPFQVENPYLLKTRPEIVKELVDNGCRDLIAHSVSCAHTQTSTTEAPHCGTCSQCIDRRFGVLAAGCTDEDDPPDRYAVDLLTGERTSTQDLTFAQGYVDAARAYRSEGALDLLAQRPELARATQYVPHMGVADATEALTDLHRRHGHQVFDVLSSGLARHAASILSGELEMTSILMLAVPPGQRGQRPSKQSFLLTLEDLARHKRTPSGRARLVGRERYSVVDREVGVRQLLFLCPLFAANREIDDRSDVATVVSESDLVNLLEQWAEAGHVTFSGRDTRHPQHRVTKMWGLFVKAMEKEKSLERKFDSYKDPESREKLYGIRLRPQELQNLIKDLPAILLDPREPSPGRR